jgi:hypothetical protein
MNLFVAITTFFSIHFYFGQNYYTGIPEGRDTLYDAIDKKVVLSSANYRDVGSRSSLKPFAPYPGDQGQYGTCAAWATTYCARTILKSIAENETNKTFITENAFSPGFIYRLASLNRDCDGSFTTECAKQISINGVPKLYQFNEPCPSYLRDDLFELAHENKIKDYVKLWDDDRYNGQISPKTKIDLVKKGINEKYPIVISIICPNSFMNNGNSEIWMPTEDVNSEINHKHGRHALCVVGYDDEKYGGAFEIQNSWGTDWGNEGYIWIKYEDFTKFTYQAIEMIGFENYLNVAPEVSGGLKVILSDGKLIEATYSGNGIYKLNKPLSSGQRFRLYINSSAQTYLYSFNIDNKGQLNKIFPFEDVSPLLNYKNNDVPIPSEEKHMRLDGRAGREYLCLLYSKKTIDIDGVMSKLTSQNNTNTIQKKFENCFGDELKPFEEIQFNNDSNEISFSTLANKDDIILLIIEIDHID